MQLNELRATLDYAAVTGQKLDSQEYARLEQLILDKTENDQYRQLLLDRLMLLK